MAEFPGKYSKISSFRAKTAIREEANQVTQMAKSQKHSKPGPATSQPPAEAEILAAAYRKVLDKRPLSRDEQRAIARHEKQKDERLRWEHYRTIPLKHWREMSGRQNKCIYEQAARYGLPMGGPIIDLPAFVRAFHGFLADNAGKLARDDDGMLVGGNSPALERYREERAQLARLERREREGSLLPRDDVRRSLGRISSILRGAVETLQRQYGAEAAAILNEALDDAERDLARQFGDGKAGADAHHAT